MQEHQRYRRTDTYCQLTRREQVTVCRLRTGHNHLNYNLHFECCIGYTEQRPCGTGNQTAEPLLQSCPLFKQLRKGIWPDHSVIVRKVNGSLENLRRTATFIAKTRVPCVERKEEEGGGGGGEKEEEEGERQPQKLQRQQQQQRKEEGKKRRRRRKIIM